MRLLRWGPPGHERPGLLDEGGTIRDLSGVVLDLSPAELSDADDPIDVEWDAMK